MTATFLPAQEIIPLYESTVCGLTESGKDSTVYRENIGTVVTRVGRVTLHHYRPVPSARTGGAVIIAPGGGYYVQAWDWEGVDFARRFTSMGLDVFILRYRLPAHIAPGECKANAALEDAQQAILLVRERADELGIDPDKIAMMGFSAGGHLAGSAAIHHTVATRGSRNVSSRPDLSILVYPVTIIDDSEYGHSGSAGALLGKNYLENPQWEKFNLPQQVHADVPPTLLIHAGDDEGVPPENSIRYYRALLDRDVPASLHIFPDGGHGFAMGTRKTGAVRGWVDVLAAWLDQYGFLSQND